jgi:hypothetical protein
MRETCRTAGGIGSKKPSKMNMGATHSCYIRQISVAVDSQTHQKTASNAFDEYESFDSWGSHLTDVEDWALFDTVIVVIVYLYFHQ